MPLPIRPRNRDVNPGQLNVHPTQFAATPNRDGDISLNKSADVAPESVRFWLDQNGLNLPETAVDDLAQRLSAAPKANTIAWVGHFQAVHEEHLGYTYEDAENAEAAVLQLENAGLMDLAVSVRNIIDAGRNRPRPSLDADLGTGFADGSYERPVPAEDSRVQAGEVFDNILAENGRTFTRAGTAPVGEPGRIRFQANRELTDEELTLLGPVVGYAMMSTLAGESAGTPERDSPYSFAMDKDTSKGTGRFDAFEERLTDTVRDGSPIRLTDRKGAGTKGTRKAQGLGDETLAFEIYYDHVFRLDW